MMQTSFRARPVLVAIVCGATFVNIVSCVRLPRAPHLSQAQTTSRPSLTDDETPASPILNINTATPAELEKLPGIGKALAARIVEHRELYGAFRRAEHLIMVRGISDRRFREMRALVKAE